MDTDDKPIRTKLDLSKVNDNFSYIIDEVDEGSRATFLNPFNRNNAKYGDINDVFAEKGKSVTYYEVYHSANLFQEDSNLNGAYVEATATYTLQRDDNDEYYIDVLNQEFNSDGSVKSSIEGKGYFENQPQNNKVKLALRVEFDSIPFQPLFAELTGSNYYITYMNATVFTNIVTGEKIKVKSLVVQSPNGYLWILTDKPIIVPKLKLAIVRLYLPPEDIEYTQPTTSFLKRLLGI